MIPNNQQQRNRDRLAEVNRQLSELYNRVRFLELEKRRLEHRLSIPAVWTATRPGDYEPPRWEYDEP